MMAAPSSSAAAAHHDDDDVVTAEYLASEIAAAERALQENERKQLLWEASESELLGEQDALGRLRVLERTADDLWLAQGISNWMAKYGDDSSNNDHENGNEDGMLFVQRSDVQRCWSLGKLLCRHERRHKLLSTTTSKTAMTQPLFRQLYEQEYLPFHGYVWEGLILSLRDALQQARYPEGTTLLLRQVCVTRGSERGGGGDSEDDRYNMDLLDAISFYCESLVRIESPYRELLRHSSSAHHQHQQEPTTPMSGTSNCNNSKINMNTNAIDVIVLELCRPFVERIRFHFLVKDEARLTSSRIDRLPEWLFGYFREHIFQAQAGGGGTTWDFIVKWLATTRWDDDDENEELGREVASMNDSANSNKLSRELSSLRTKKQQQTYDLADLPLHFLNEVIRIVQWVLGERNFFRHPKVAGPDSNPLLLCNAIQQLLQFDDYLQGLVRQNYPDSVSAAGGGTSSYRSHHQRRLLSLTDIFVAGDDDLLRWWLQREQETVFARLNEDISHASALVNRISPRAELFCALMVSIKAKAAVFSFSAPYMKHVAAPLCMQFVDAVHLSATDLKEALQQRKNKLMSDDERLDANVNSWVELINGTHMAAQILSSSSSRDGGGADPAAVQQSLNAEHDLDRFGRSLQSLRQVLLDEFCVAFVETLLMERAKFAVYLMRCPNLLCDEIGIDDEDALTSTTTANHSHTLSPVLRETALILKRFLRVCEDSPDDDERPETREMAQYAPRRMRDGVLALITDKLLDVAMNYQGMTPDLRVRGSAVFARDVHALFGTALLPPVALRLLDITRVMSMESSQLVQMGGALCGLAGLPAPLSEDAFSGDERLFDEATSMVRAKGLAWVELEDVISILNRRRDLNSRTTPDTTRKVLEL